MVASLILSVLPCFVPSWLKLELHYDVADFEQDLAQLPAIP